MPTTQESFLGVGIYSVPEAAHLSGVSKWCIYRWLRGYRFTSGGRVHRSPPVWKPQLPPIAGRRAVGFLDLQEVRAVGAFRQQGVSWRVIRAAESKACDRYAVSHPFCTLPFKTDGRRIFVDVYDELGERAILDFLDSQICFERVIEPCLADLEFDGTQPLRWWPMGKHRRVLIDPVRAFGQPIATPEGVPTRLLATAYYANKSLKDVALWYDVELDSVRDALEYEQKLAA